jgi:hypothetical protein
MRATQVFRLEQPFPALFFSMALVIIQVLLYMLLSWRYNEHLWPIGRCFHTARQASRYCNMEMGERLCLKPISRNILLTDSTVKLDLCSLCRDGPNTEDLNNKPFCKMLRFI